MKKITKFLTATALIIVAATTGSYAQATATASATGNIITPITISLVTSMNFGNIAVSPTSGGTVVLSASAGTRTSTGGVTLPATAGTVTAANFTVSGASGYTYAITLPSSATITDGTTYTQTYTYTVPTYQNLFNMHVVGFVVDQATGKVLNSIQSPVSAAGINKNISNAGINMYPNPSKGIVNIIGVTGKSQITVTNVLGETVMNVENTKVLDLSNFANGLYFIKINSNNHIVTEKIIINK